MGALNNIDLLVMVLYFAGLLGIGYYTMRREQVGHASESFLAADRDMNLFFSTGTTAATDIGGGFSIAMGGLGFSLGLSGSWLIAISGLSIAAASFLMVPRIKRWADRTRGLTTGDLFERRFDRRTGTVAAVLVGLSWFAFVGGQVIAGGKLLQATVHMNLTAAIIVSGGIILAYTMMGGLKAVIYTDVFQMIVLLGGIVFVMVPLGLHRVGGWSAMVEHFTRQAETAAMVSWSAVGWKRLLGWFLSIFPIWFIAITAMQRVIAARDEKTARRAFLLTGVPLEWPMFALGTTLVGMFARMLVPELRDAELATPTMILTLLPTGLTGVVIAAYVAAIMSTADSCLIGPVAIFTNDIYHKLLRPRCSDAQLVRVARLSTLVMGVVGIIIAYLVPHILKLILHAYTFGSAGLFAPTIGLLYWRRTTATGALWSIVAGGSTAVVWTLAGDPWGLSASYCGWGVSFVVLFIVSLLTEHHPDEDVEIFS